MYWYFLWGGNVMKTKKPPMPLLVFLTLYMLFISFSLFFKYELGEGIFMNFKLFSADMFKLFPAAFILVGLFTVWIDRSTVEKYFGKSSGIKGHISAVLLACTTLYPFVVVLPMASGLYKKGAKLEIILTYLGASAVCRIPMSIFEASFLGLKFTIIRYIVSLPLIILSSMLIGKLMKDDEEKIKELEIYNV